jgi:hypothetical protein
MTSDSPPGPLDFEPHTASVRTRMAKASNITLWIILAGPIWPLWDTLLGFLIALSISRPARAGGGILRELILLVIFFLLLSVCGIFYQEKIAKTSWFMRLRVGRSRFIPLDGPPRRMFNFILKCDNALDLILKPEDRSILPAFGNLEFASAERFYRSEYERLKRDPSDWPETWNKITLSGIGNATYGNTIKAGHWTMLWLKIVSVTKLVTPLTLLYLTVALWLLTATTNGGHALVLLQFMLAAGFLIAVVIFINYTYSFGEIRIIAPKETLSALGIPTPPTEQPDSADEPSVAERREMAKQLEAEYEGKVILADVVTRDGYIESIRNFFSRIFLINSLANMLIFWILLGLQVPFALLWSSWSDSQIASWTMRMAIGVGLFPFVLLAVLALSFIVLANLKRFGILLVSGLTLALVPPLITYALRGSIGTARTTVIISSIITGIIGCIGSAIADVVNEHTRRDRT